ncbi:MAG: enoyl-CoA hydratase/isomerase family protein [Acidobacteriaceae bacterium]|nr:enoyl-CoA hydratase/isomerase family protein [Acidobacteriaceae bacterium]
MPRDSSKRKLTMDREGEVGILTLQRAFSLNSEGKIALTEAIVELSNSDSPRALLLNALDPRAFLVDVEELADMQASNARLFSAAGHKLAQAIEQAPFPVIAAVEGQALGGGCELVLACDLAVAGEDATFGQIEALGGVMPGFGGTWRLARRIGYQRALEMLFTATVIGAHTALSYGLILEVTERGKSLESAKVLAERISRTSKASISAIKLAASVGWNLPPTAADAFEEVLFPTLFGPEQSARMHAYLKQQEGD